jgi:hypothetical protein
VALAKRNLIKGRQYFADGLQVTPGWRRNVKKPRSRSFASSLRIMEMISIFPVFPLSPPPEI